MQRAIVLVIHVTEISSLFTDEYSFNGNFSCFGFKAYKIEDFGLLSFRVVLTSGISTQI